MGTIIVWMIRMTYLLSVKVCHMFIECTICGLPGLAKFLFDLERERAW